ncbi:hypothetical protein HK099_000835 [Clydaea vesicula]|uniref:ABC transporter domain-containing protein n=1 Tax=Clydaea vesicula TaxID=447962 RepID=A0AAD5TUX3_9FUNG|nr:hypothetical protein HK099_000835 [Clydaea vesicula]
MNLAIILGLLNLVFSQIQTNQTINPTNLNQTIQCPICESTFNCLTNKNSCNEFASCSTNGQCICPDGWTGVDCSKPACNSTNFEPQFRTPRSGNQCQCDNGFIGQNCNVCTQDSVCKGRSNAPVGSTYVCNKLNTVWQNSNMYCDVSVAELAFLFPNKVTATVNRNITGGTTLANLWYEDIEQFYCKAEQCSQKIVDLEYIWSCQQVKCRCIPGTKFCGNGGTIDLTRIIETEVSGSFSVNFPSETADMGTLFFDSLKAVFKKGLPLGPCRVGECVDPGYKINLLPVVTPPLSPAAIAGIAVGSGFLGLILFSLIIAKIYQLRLRKIPLPAPRTGAQLRFRDISYEVNNKSILKNVSGCANSGRLMAILGPSGAGKSTFLDILAGKKKSGKVFGDILINGKTMSSKKFRAISGYVDQEDLLIPNLTVKETLLFSANLRLPEGVTKLQKEKIVQETLDTLGLSHIENSKIGGNGVRGISGGEKRRVSIGVELVTSPSILFLDEPTSGLDSYNAMMVVKTLHTLANKGGKTLIFTIHQPRSDVYKLFDDVLLLAKGSVMYMGDAKEAETVFANQGSPCPSGYNIADHLLDIATLEALNEKPEAGVGIAVDAFIISDQTNETLRLRKSNKMEKSDFSDPYSIIDSNSSYSNSGSDPNSTTYLTSTENTETFSVSFLTQLNQLMGRSSKILFRESGLLLAHVLISIILGAFVGALYWRADSSLGGFQNHLGSNFFCLSLIGFSSLSAIGTFTTERLIFLRERSNGFYGPFPFFLSKILFDILPLRLIPGILMGTITFFMIGYGGSFLKYIVVVLLFSSQCGMFCLAIACAITDFGTATLVAAISMLFQMLMAGFLINAGRKKKKFLIFFF